MKVQRPEGMTDEEKAAWMESEEGRRFLDQAEWKPIRFTLKDPSLVPVTMRLPADLPNRLRRLAESRSTAYQTLARQWLLERCQEEEAIAEADTLVDLDRLPDTVQRALEGLSDVERAMVLFAAALVPTREIARRFPRSGGVSSVIRCLESAEAMLAQAMAEGRSAPVDAGYPSIESLLRMAS